MTALGYINYLDRTSDLTEAKVALHRLERHRREGRAPLGLVVGAMEAEIRRGHECYDDPMNAHVGFTPNPFVGTERDLHEIAVGMGWQSVAEVADEVRLRTSRRWVAWNLYLQDFILDDGSEGCDREVL